MKPQCVNLSSFRPQMHISFILTLGLLGGKAVIFKFLSRTLSISCEIAFRWIPKDFADRKRRNYVYVYTPMAKKSTYDKYDIHGWPSTQPGSLHTVLQRTHSRAHCSPGARLCEQWGHGCVNNGARLCASARLCRGSPVILVQVMNQYWTKRTKRRFTYSKVASTGPLQADSRHAEKKSYNHRNGNIIIWIKLYHCMAP